MGPSRPTSGLRALGPRRLQWATPICPASDPRSRSQHLNALQTRTETDRMDIPSPLQALVRAPDSTFDRWTSCPRGRLDPRSQHKHLSATSARSGAIGWTCPVLQSSLELADWSRLESENVGRRGTEQTFPHRIVHNSASGIAFGALDEKICDAVAEVNIEPAISTTRRPSLDTTVLGGSLAIRHCIGHALSRARNAVRVG